MTGPPRHHRRRSVGPAIGAGLVLAFSALVVLGVAQLTEWATTGHWGWFGC